MNLAAVEIKAFVPARDFEQSKQFYLALGFEIAWSSEELAHVRYGATRFLLQNFHARSGAAIGIPTAALLFAAVAPFALDFNGFSVSAEDAVRAHRDVRARVLFPVHWGTFNLAFHEWDDPIKRTVAAARTGQVELVTPRVGEIVDLDRTFVSSAWWETVRRSGAVP